MRKRSLRLFVIITSIACTAMALPGCGGKGGVTTGPKTAPTSATTPTEKATLQVYFTEGEQPAAVERVADKGGGEVALEELLKGPTEGEKEAGINTAIPEGTKLNSYVLEGDRAKVDFSRELLNYGGGSARVQAITNQITMTVLANEKNATGVAITIDGVPAEEALQP